MMQKRFIPAVVWAAGLSVLMSGCASDGMTKETSLNNNDYYEVYHEGRLYVFDDAVTYLSFLDVGETSYRKVRIGAGPHGETIVFGLTSADKKKREGIASIDMYDGKLAPAAEFYGEVHMEGRIYVFNDWNELQAFKQTGEAAYRFTEIGAGPGGETVVFVLTKEKKKVRPVATIAKFQELHAS
jgi:hypothetical protein